MIASRHSVKLRPLATVAAVAMLASCSGGGGQWHATNVSGSVPDLSLSLTRAGDGKAVDAGDYRGKVVALYFGYTYCPDVCPMTLSNMAQAVRTLGPAAKDVRVLFVTVDPNRDTPAVLSQYVKAFGPDFEGLYGTADQLARVAKRYRVAYSVTPSPDPAKYEVTHSSALYVFDKQGNARLLVSSLSSDKPDIKGTTADLKRLVGEKD
ncbi:SCO family protein [Stakelama sediminis]|uniref:Protein SCO1/2 n=1 Tax=Stakelama sediminis TaxID=463200 RepID=A0A840YUB5_9SPHN|nr:SCO family protein [Stakelama sediminis]MBB5717228.1 protein SCO1/2 [Stakelama sediminis]